MKRSPLRRRQGLRTAKPAPKVPDPLREAWKRPRYGRCQACGLIDNQPLHGHHAIEKQALMRAGVSEYDPRNRIDLCERCHMNHTYGQENRKLSAACIPNRAVAFAIEVLGEPFVADHIRRHYIPA